MHGNRMWAMNPTGYNNAPMRQAEAWRWQLL